MILTHKSKNFFSDIQLSCGQVVCKMSINVDSRFLLDCYRVYGVEFLLLSIENFMVGDSKTKKRGGG